MKMSASAATQHWHWHAWVRMLRMLLMHCKPYFLMKIGMFVVMRLMRFTE
jgi:hypothetical protein